jgi:hypothetical protein
MDFAACAVSICPSMARKVESWSCASALVGNRHNARASGSIASVFKMGAAKHNDLPPAALATTATFSPRSAASMARA